MLVFFTNLSFMVFLVRYFILLLLFSVIDSFVWFWLGSLHKNIWLHLGSIFDSNFSYYTLMTLSVILLSMLMILLSTFSKYDQAFDLWQQLELASELESYLWDTVEWGQMWLVDFNAEKLNWFLLTGLVTLVLLIWKFMGLFLRKNNLIRSWCWLFFYSRLGLLHYLCC